MKNMIGLIRHISIEVRNRDEQLALGGKIHKQLMGNADYVDCNIIVNIEEVNEINIYIFKECTCIPELKI